MESLIVIAVVLLIVAAAAAYVIKEKKKGNKCIGCPHSGLCGKDGTSCGNCKNN